MTFCVKARGRCAQVFKQALRISCCAVIVLGLQLTANNAVAQNNSKVVSFPKPMSSGDTLEQRVKLASLVMVCKASPPVPDIFQESPVKPAGYLFNQLVNFREQRRRYPFMNYIVAHLSDDYLREMGEYFLHKIHHMLGRLPVRPVPPFWRTVGNL